MRSSSANRARSPARLPARPINSRKSPRGLTTTRPTAKVDPPQPNRTSLFDLERKKAETDIKPVRVSAAAEWSARLLTCLAMTRAYKAGRRGRRPIHKREQAAGRVPCGLFVILRRSRGPWLQARTIPRRRDGRGRKAGGAGSSDPCRRAPHRRTR